MDFPLTKPCQAQSCLSLACPFPTRPDGLLSLFSPHSRAGCAIAGFLLQVDEGGAFVEEAGIGLDGRLPVNPHGGLLSESHPGRPGSISHLAEAVVQLRGDAGPRQVDGADVALVHGVGGIMSSHATAILGRG